MMILPLLLLAGSADPFDDRSAWRASASDGVTATLAAPDRGMLRLDYDFAGVSGYAVAQRALPIAFPEDFEVSFRVRGTGGVNDLQVKFVDASGDNVWWHVIRNFRPTGAWQTIRIPRRRIEFAWGPTTDRTLRATAAAEFVVVRGRDGGSGAIELDDFTLAPVDPRPLPAPVASAPAAIDGDPATVWAATPRRPLVIDFGGRRELGGVELDWAGGAGAERYELAASDDGRTWRTLYRVREGDGGRDPVALPETAVRYLQLSVSAPARLREIRIMPLAYAATPDAFITAIARERPRGTFPRAYSGEQSYWTLVGTDGGAQSGLIDEDARIEVAKGGFTIEPAIETGGRRFGWADVTGEPSLEDGYLPIPHVRWNGADWSLDSSAFAYPDAAGGGLVARYRVTNRASGTRQIRLRLAIRPFQVNPPAQFLSQQGGVSAISAIGWARGALTVTSPGAIAGDPATVRVLRPTVPPARVTMAAFEAGALDGTGERERGSVTDPSGLASGTFVYDLTLAAGESREVALDMPFAAGPGEAPRPVAELAGSVRDAWRAKLGAVRITLPPARQAIADTVRSALAHILMSRTGAVLKPGTRSYDRSWIRDGTMIAEGLLRLGQVEPARAYLEWYSGKLFANGKVPCCVDDRGADPVAENDSHGQYIHLATLLYRYSGDAEALAGRWPAMEKAWRYMDGLRRSERTAANLTAERRAYYGLMPPSISHEGYSAKPQYSLWDDFWALRGYKDAALVAAVLRAGDAGSFAAARDEFAGDIHAAIAAAARRCAIDFIPGATSLCDLDPTSTTIALAPGGEHARLDPALLRRTFERHWDRIAARRAGTPAWSDYTPYELRTVSSFIRLGWRARANALLDGYMADRRPAAWNGWAEVVGRDPREVRFIGDMPHAWIASDFIRSALDMFAYENEDRDALVLAGGLLPADLDGAGAGIAGLRTPHGTLDFAMRRQGGRVIVEIGGDARPPGGFVLTWPLATTPRAVTIDGRTARFDPEGLRIAVTGKPIRVVVEAD